MYVDLVTNPLISGCFWNVTTLSIVIRWWEADSDHAVCPGQFHRELWPCQLCELEICLLPKFPYITAQLSRLRPFLLLTLSDITPSALLSLPYPPILHLKVQKDLFNMRHCHFPSCLDSFLISTSSLMKGHDVAIRNDWRAGGWRRPVNGWKSLKSSAQVEHDNDSESELKCSGMRWLDWVKRQKRPNLKI